MITSPATATFTNGVYGSFTVTASGSPTPALTTDSYLPPGLTLTDNRDGTATLAGVPSTSSPYFPGFAGGDFFVTITASNGVSPDATQVLEVVVQARPFFWPSTGQCVSPGMIGPCAYLTAGQYGSVTFAAGGLPTPSLSVSGALPAGLNFVGKPGSATLSGIPAAGNPRPYNLTIVATNSVGSAGLYFMLFVIEPSTGITSPPSSTFTVGRPSSFTITTVGLATLRVSGALPAGVSFIDHGGGTATLSGTPATGTGGVYHLTITAAAPGWSNRTQAFTLTVQAPPTVLVSAPSSRRLYARGERVRSSFSCREGAGGTGIASCLDRRGRRSGAWLDTTKIGPHTFTVTARSRDGLSTSKTVSYRVLAPTRVHVSTIRPALSGTAGHRQLRLTVTGTIQTNGKRVATAGGTLFVSVSVRMPRGRAQRSARVSVRHGCWRITMLLPAVNHGAKQPPYLITMRYSGDHNHPGATTQSRIQLKG